jgi:hypothetical protein
MPDDLLSEVNTVALKALGGDAHKPRYVTTDELGVKKADPLPAGLRWERIRDVLPQYHLPTFANDAMFVCFGNLAAYNKFFAKGIPRDLFAVRDIIKGTWCLCMGTMMGHRDPVAVGLVFATRKRVNIRETTWQVLEQKLDALFLETDPDKLSGQAICLHNLALNPVDRQGNP